MSEAPATTAATSERALEASRALRSAVTVDGLRAHVEALARIARRHGGTRASGTPGYEASVRYVEERLREAGYEVTRQEFPYGGYVEHVERGRVLEPGERPLAIDALEHSPSTPGGEIIGPIAVAPVDEDGSHGCEVADFADGSYDERAALVKRGTCAFAAKARNAADAVAVVLYGDSDSFADWSLGAPEDASIPAVAVSGAEGEALAREAAEGRTVVSLEVEASSEGISWNVVSDLPGTRSDSVVMAGGHLDSVDEGPGLNDNGSGVAALLEIALRLADEPRPPATVRFAFWGTEELGLVGSRYYAMRLDEEEARRIAVYFNLDMIGSPNFGRFVYRARGTGDERAERASQEVERVLLDYFRAVDLPAERIRFGSRSDQASFRRLGIPTGGLFTGAGEQKTEREARVYGGRAGEPYDACYHRACDGAANVDLDVVHEMADAAAHALLVFAASSSPARG